MMEKKRVDLSWDFFIAYSHRDKETARQLYKELAKIGSTVFLDEVELEPGDAWDIEIAKAQQQSNATIALISGNSTNAHYAREEIQSAIHFMRTHPTLHRIIPVYIDDDLQDATGMIYGLRLIQGISMSSIGGIEKVALKISNTLSIKQSTLKKEDVEPSHLLLSYPPGPIVPLSLIPRSIFDTYSMLIRMQEARLVVSEANSFRQEATPETPFIIPLNKITSPDKIPGFDFWLEAFEYAGLQGPRMVAALLFMLPTDNFSSQAKLAREKLLLSLLNHK